ncbi:alpha/beta fold hydrolase [Leptolyngbya sp. FACHB-261]|uniref:lipase family alpha/beta hydrolase n=1 Tax=Leptolyngbya sp. FACHB-261 TaxID=2692806 RepID=UPI00168272E1|nr:alpha/beta fold hydrolase [Leptolyngbya sp. FACHB-261]MBD2102804.1 alpha/beta fold hydrolase [Leptolyngbya sp. FACHB-261]
MLNPVLLVHGIDDTELIFTPLRAHLEEQGWTVHTLNLRPNNGDVGLDKLAAQVRDRADQLFAPSERFDLVGFSMGGIVSRYYVQRLGGLERVERFITIASPHHGTWMGFARNNLGAAQMRPNSPFLRELNRDVATLEKVQFTSLWTPYDLMIVPANSSELPVGRNLQVPILTHAWMINHPRSFQILTESLSAPLVKA